MKTQMGSAQVEQKMECYENISSSERSGSINDLNYTDRNTEDGRSVSDRSILPNIVLPSHRNNLTLSSEKNVSVKEDSSQPEPTETTAFTSPKKEANALDVLNAPNESLTGLEGVKTTTGDKINNAATKAPVAVLLKLVLNTSPSKSDGVAKKYLGELKAAKVNSSGIEKILPAGIIRTQQSTSASHQHPERKDEVKIIKIFKSDTALSKGADNALKTHLNNFSTPVFDKDKSTADKHIVRESIFSENPSHLKLDESNISTKKVIKLYQGLIGKSSDGVMSKTVLVPSISSGKGNKICNTTGMPADMNSVIMVPDTTKVPKMQMTKCPSGQVAKTLVVSLPNAALVNARVSDSNHASDKRSDGVISDGKTLTIIPGKHANGIIAKNLNLSSLTAMKSTLAVNTVADHQSLVTKRPEESNVSLNKVMKEGPPVLHNGEVSNELAPLSIEKKNPASIVPPVSAEKRDDIDGSDPLSTLAFLASLQRDNESSATTKQQQQSQPSAANLDGWHDVGPLLSEPRCNVTHFYVAPPQCDDVNQKWQWDTGADFSKYLKVKLKPNTAYRFRVAAIDSNGQGPWSEVATFKTYTPGYPGVPSCIKVTKIREGAQLSWEAPVDKGATVTEYAVYMSVKRDVDHSGLLGGSALVCTTGSGMAFVRVYSGPDTKCVVRNSALDVAHVDMTGSRPAILFRIAASNNIGYGPATQIRWLQNAPTITKRPAEMLSQNASEQKRIKH